MAYFAYGYFVKTPTGIFHSGHDFGPTLDSYKVGDSLGVRNGVEGIVVGILKGEAAKRTGGYDVFVLLEQRAPRAAPGAAAVAEQDFFSDARGSADRRDADSRAVAFGKPSPNPSHRWG
jgi:hypothetical protein